MAQDFVGSNNINLLVPSGQFGTRLMGGKDAASPRYIFTYLSPIARLLFPEADDVLLTHREDDGQQIEPEFYCPVIPLLLVNGSQGIGTGWSTFIPPHNPLDVLAYIRAKLDGKTDLPLLTPWVRGFNGDMYPKQSGTKSGSNGFTSAGRIKKKTLKSVVIEELPVGRWTSDYKEHLLKMRSKSLISSIVENHTTTSVHFTVNMTSIQLSRITDKLLKTFKLESNMPTTNMNAFKADNVIEKFETAEAMADAFFPSRLKLYHDRKSVMESNTAYSATMSQSKADFITAVRDSKIDLVKGQKTKSETIDILDGLGFTKMSELMNIKRDNAVDKRNIDTTTVDLTGETEEDQVEVNREKEFDYLLNMPLSSLTAEKIDELQNNATKAQAELKTIRKTTAEDLWRADLDKLEAHLS
jgi:DNA topoisomerase-2